MKTMQALILRLAAGLATALAINVIAENWSITKRIPTWDDGCIFHKPLSRWTKEDHDFLELRIRRLQAMPAGAKQPARDRACP